MNRIAKILVYTIPENRDIPGVISEFIQSGKNYDIETDFGSFTKRVNGIAYDLIMLLSLPEMMDIVRSSTVISNSVNQRTPLLITDDGKDMSSAVPRDESSGPDRKGGILRLKRKAERLDDPDLVDTIITTAATLGHEINNPLMSISANTEILLSRVDSLPGDVVRKLRSISGAAERIQEVLHNLTDLERLKYRRTPSGRMIDFEDSDIFIRLSKKHAAHTRDE